MDKFKSVQFNDLKLELYSDDEFRLDISEMSYSTLNKKQTIELYNYLGSILGFNSVDVGDNSDPIYLIKCKDLTQEIPCRYNEKEDYFYIQRCDGTILQKYTHGIESKKLLK